MDSPFPVSVNNLSFNKPTYKKCVRFKNKSEFVVIRDLIQIENDFLFEYINFCYFPILLRSQPTLIVKHVCDTNFAETVGPPVPLHVFYTLMTGPALSSKEVKLFYRTP